MSIFVESLRRLYHAEPKRITKAKVDALLKAGKLTQTEHDYILAE